jgi:two-component system OmpR family response regulator
VAPVPAVTALEHSCLPDTDHAATLSHRHSMRILIAEDDAETAGFIERGLGDLSHVTVRARSGEEALDLGATVNFDAIILDRMLPEIDGLEILRRWRAAGIKTPVLMLTALGGIADRVEGLEAGADDYLIKPFAFAELAARIAALLRRPPINDAPTRIQVGDIEIDLLRREVRRAGREIHLQPREFALLEQLSRHAGKVVTRTMFLESVWGFHFDPQTNIVESHLSRLRSKLNDGFANDPIETLRGIGYRMRADG